MKKKEKKLVHNETQTNNNETTPLETRQKNKRTFIGLNLFNNIPIGFKYLILFLFSVALFIAATIIVYTQLSAAKKDVQTIVSHSEVASLMTDMALLIEQQDSSISGYSIAGHMRHVEEFEQMEVELAEIFTILDTVFTEGEEELTYGAIKINSESISNLFLNRLVEQRSKGEDVLATQLEIDTHKTLLINLVSDLINIYMEGQESAVVKVNQSMNQSIVFLVVINIISIVLGFVTLIFISRYISKNLKRVVEATARIARGDLTAEPLTYEGKDEIGLLADSVNSLRFNMRDIIAKVNTASQAVTNSSDLLMLSSRDVKEGSEQMVVTMEQLASGAETQADSATNLAEKMSHFTGSVQASQADGDAVVRSSEEVISLTNEGTKLMSQSVQQMERIDHIVSHSVERVKGLDEKSEQISHLVDVVKGIAEQTNLLALNAAIEAARAGEHGRGFAVVAEEVGKLADEVARSVTEITTIVQMIQTETNEVAETLDNGYEEVQTGTKQIEATGESFHTIEQFISSMVENISKVAGRLGEITRGSEEMNHLIEDIAAVSEEAAAGVEESSAATQQTSSSMDEISANAEELANLAEQLNREINVFKI
ncbi:MAG TPA: methyl-accepting chemotaxis protein [Pseudogracilibacillus sp.]|nr:methyl-accepting chemotaxis protein [Pseudogracilibacillus sp.]